MRKKKIELDDFYSKYGHIAPNIFDSPVQYRAGYYAWWSVGFGHVSSLFACYGFYPAMLSLIDLEDLLLLRGIGEKTIKKVKSANLVDLQKKWEVKYAEKYFANLLNHFKEGIELTKGTEEFDLELEEDGNEPYWVENFIEEEIEEEI